MLFQALSLMLALFSISHGDENSKEMCSDENISSHCKCEILSPHLSSDVGLYSGFEVKLMCNGSEKAIKAVNKVRELSKNSLVFINLEISSASFQNLSHNNLKQLSQVKRLNLSKNNIKFAEFDAFKDLSDLEILDLSHNNFRDIDSGIFKFLINLRNISLANNELKYIEPNAFQNMSELLQLDLSGNYLTYVDSNWFINLSKLLMLSLANNEIRSIAFNNTIPHNAFQKLVSLQNLNLSGNSLTEFTDLTFYHLGNLKTLSLATNNLKTLNENIFKRNLKLENVNLTGNLWVCDKKMLPLNDWLKKYEAHEFRAFCSEPMELRNETLQNGLDILYLQIKIEENPTCNASMCNCTVSKDKLIVTVDCVGRNLTKLPETLPYKTRVLDLRGNFIRSLTTDHVDATQWSDVSFLFLNNNHIHSLKGLEGTWLLRNLVALHLTNNQLTEIPIHILEQFRGSLLDELYLSGNPWNCDCNTVRFQTWLQDNYKTIRELDGIRCSADSGIYSNQPIPRLLKSQLCPQHVQLVNYLDILNGLMAVAIVLIILKLSFDYWLQKQTGKLPRFFSLNIS